MNNLTERILRTVDGEQVMDIVLACTTASAYVVRRMTREEKLQVTKMIQTLFEKLTLEEKLQ